MNQFNIIKMYTIFTQQQATNSIQVPKDYKPHWNISRDIKQGEKFHGLKNWNHTGSVLFSLVQFSRSVVRLFTTPWTAAHQASLSITNSRSFLKLMSIESVMPSSHLILCRPLLLLPSIFPNIRVSSNESALHMRWPKYWRFSFSISPSNEHPGLISFRMDWLDLLAVQGTLKSLLCSLITVELC